jgi:hypothetical protein
MAVLLLDQLPVPVASLRVTELNSQTLVVPVIAAGNGLTVKTEVM